ncbi:MAG: metal ABC transporter permease, partial [Actinomycetota bacterium]
RADDVVIGSVFVWLLGLGVLFLSLYTAHRSGGGAKGSAGVGVLFGSILGLASSDVVFLCAIAVVVLATILIVARPLLLSTIDATVASARGVPVRALGIIFLGLVGLTAASATRAVGALPLLGLLAAPGAAAHRLSPRPMRALALSALIAVAAVWIGLTISYEIPRTPPTFAIVTTAVAAHALSASKPRRILRHSH